MMDKPKRVLVRDLLIFQLKLMMDGLKDLFLMQLSLVAALIDLVFGKPGRPRLFYRVLRASERFDLWLNLNGAAEQAESAPDGLFGGRAGADTLLSRIESVMQRHAPGWTDPAPGGSAGS